jgi:hypothetical protein
MGRYARLRARLRNVGCRPQSHHSIASANWHCYGRQQVLKASSDCPAMVIALRTVRSEIPLDSRRRSLHRRSSELIITALGAGTLKGGEK